MDMFGDFSYSLEAQRLYEQNLILTKKLEEMKYEFCGIKSKT